MVVGGKSGVLDRHGVELIGAKLPAIEKAEDRLLFKEAMEKMTIVRSCVDWYGRDGALYCTLLTNIGCDILLLPGSNEQGQERKELHGAIVILSTLKKRLCSRFFLLASLRFVRWRQLACLVLIRWYCFSLLVSWEDRTQF